MRSSKTPLHFLILFLAAAMSFHSLSPASETEIEELTAEAFETSGDIGSESTGSDTRSPIDDKNSIAGSHEPLVLPDFTETECTWDGNANLIQETAHDLSGQPALNNRGFYIAIYYYDEHSNLISEAYFDVEDLDPEDRKALEEAVAALKGSTTISPDGVVVRIEGSSHKSADYPILSPVMDELTLLIGKKPVDTVDGYAKAVYTYYTDHNGDSYVLTEDRYNQYGERADLEGSYSYRRDTWEDGQIISSKYFDADGNLTQPTGGYAQILYDYEPDRLAGTVTVTKRYLDADGNPLIGLEGGSIVKTVYAVLVNEDGTIPVDFLAKAMTSNTSVVSESMDYERPVLTREIFGKDENQKVLGSKRWHKVTYTYGTNGKVTRIDYTGIDDESALNSSSYASLVFTYDNLNRLIQKDYLDTEGRLTKILASYARISYDYYGDTNLKHNEYYFGADGERTMTTDSISRTEFEYYGIDENGLPIPESELEPHKDIYDIDDHYDYRNTYYDILDEYTMNHAGYARREFRYAEGIRYDSKLWKLNEYNIAWEKDYGVDMKLQKRKTGYAGWVNERNEYGQVIRITYMDDTWNPARNDEIQYASIAFEYAGTKTSEPAVYESYYDKDGNPCQNVDGYYARAMTYTGPHLSQLASEEFFRVEVDEEGKYHTYPEVSIANGAHLITYNYNGNSIQTALHYFDKEGKEFTAIKGYATLLREYNKAGSLLWEATFDEEGALVSPGGKSASQVHTYDYSNHHTGEKYFNADGNALTQSGGYASAFYGYDPAGNIISITYYNIDDEPTLVKGAARTVREYRMAHHLPEGFRLFRKGLSCQFLS